GRCAQPAEGGLDPPQDVGGFDLSGDHHGCVVRPVPGPVERLQIFDVRGLHVRTCTDRGLAVAVPAVGGPAHVPYQYAAGIALAGLQLVAHHRHLAVQVGAVQACVEHAVGLHAQDQVEGPAI